MARVGAKQETSQQDLEKLVDELMKDQPNQQLVKKLSTKLGMDYSVDPLIHMSTVLQSMNNVYLRQQRRKELEN
ncbi:hypothetical protein [Bdellovibrio sp. HCB337]|uniref:hypothetical protein n=1 Tax=Bdellovibrio sp. HCB337 TaxID=3394358 RepID=UPI0039A4C961